MRWAVVALALAGVVAFLLWPMRPHFGWITGAIDWLKIRRCPSCGNRSYDRSLGCYTLGCFQPKRSETS